MERYIPSSQGLVQTVRESLPGLAWHTFIAVLVFSCIATRIITGFQSRSTKISHEGPQTVRVTPYWFPWVGHGVSFAWNPLTCITRARKSMSEPVFGLYMGGVKQNIVLSPSMLQSALSVRGGSTTTLINYLLEKVFGDRGGIRKLKPADHHAICHNIPNQFMRDPFITEASAAAVRMIERETPNLVSFCHSIVDQTQWERGSNVTVLETSETPVCEANLFALVRNFVGQITTTVIMGQALVDTFPGLLWDLWTLDSQFTTLSLGAPYWLPLPGVSAAYAARDRLLRTLASFHKAFVAWDDGRDPGFELRDLDDVSEPIKQRIRTFRELGLSPIASAPSHLSLLWAMNANSTNIVFWNLLRVFADSKLLEEIREEISPYAKAFRPSRQETGFPIQDPPRISIDLEGLLKSCPVLKASYYETLRLDSASFSFRELTSDLTITESEGDAALDGLKDPRTYKLEKGEYIAIPHGAHQNDKRYFPDPSSYDPSRFLLTDSETGEKKADMRTMKPFGGGMSGCKGQAFAEREILASTAAIISMWDITPVGKGNWTIPGHKPATGAFLPKKDVRVQLKVRV